MKQLLKLFTVLAVALPITAVLLSTPAHAVTAADWNASNIIDDTIFYNSSSMSVGDIQTFLNTQVPSCDTQGTQAYNSSMNDAQYAASQGWPGPPYVCLKDYIQVPQSSSIVDTYTTALTKVSDSVIDTTCGPTANQTTPAPAGQGCSAAQIIKAAADDNNINPKVLLVTLQKESLNLIYDNWPLQNQYTNAMGYGCPDNAPCDPSYAGFYNQVNNAAWQWNYYKVHAYDKNSQGNYIYRQQPYNTSSVGYNPTTSCGGTSITMSNYATTGLYNYTPYQPNQAALNNLYGTGDSCSAYGNRNFWRIFNDWFGTTHGSDYAWQVVSQSYYTDATKTTPASSDIPPGGSVHLVLKVKNTGNLTWNSSTGPINLAVLGSDSIFCGPGWLSCNRPATLEESSVAPGQTGTFEFDAYNPTNAVGSFRMYVSLVAEGKEWFNNPGVNFYFTPQKAVYTWSIQSQSAYTDSTMTTAKNMWYTRPGDTAYLVIKAKNTGNVTWSNSGPNPINLAVNGDANSSLCTPAWLSCNRPAKLQEASVPPGGVGTFAFPVTIPNKPGDYIEYYSLVSEGRAWFDSTGINYWIKIIPDSYTWSIVSQSAYTDSTMTTAKNMWYTHPGDTAYLVVKAENTGNVTWSNSGSNPIDFATVGDKMSSLCTPAWLSCNRPARLEESSVAPGQIGTFAFPVTIPNKIGDYIEYYGLVSEGKTWFDSTGINYWIKIVQ